MSVFKILYLLAFVFSSSFREENVVPSPYSPFVFPFENA